MKARHITFLLAASVSLAPEGVLAASRSYLAAGVYEEAGAVRFETRGGVKSEPLGDWRVAGDPVGGLVGLIQRDAEGATIRALDATGNTVGSVRLDVGQDGVVTDLGVIAVPRALHGPVRPHELDFFTLDGKLARSVSEPTLRIAVWTVETDGQLVTVNLGPGEKDRTILVYGPDGGERWRYVAPADGEGVPEARATPDGQRLLVMKPDPVAREVELTILGPGNVVVKQQRLPLITAMVFRPDGQRIGVAGWGGVMMLDAGSGEVLWRDEKGGGVLKGGLRFDADGNRLFVVEASREPKAPNLKLRVRRLRTADGAAESADLGTVPADRAPAVRGIVPVGVERSIVLHDRVVRVPARAWRAR